MSTEEKEHKRIWLEPNLDDPEGRTWCQVNIWGDQGVEYVLASTIADLQRENAALKQEAQCHAMEARTANSTINEIYQVITGARGEPGNWHGAEPVRKYVEAAEAEVKRLQTELALSKPLYSRRQIEARVKLLEDELESAACVLETFADGKPADNVDAIMMRVMAERNRAALASTGGEHHAE